MGQVMSMDTLSPTAIEWLDNRGLDTEVAVKLGLGSRSARGTEEITIPFIVDGQVIGRKYRNLNARDDQSQWRFDTGFKGEVFWNQQALDAANDPELTRQPLIITEGEWDALAAIQCGFPRTVSMPNGAGNTTCLETQFDKLEAVDLIIIAADGDSVGANLQREMLRRFGRARCKLLKYPKGCKDLNDALQKYGSAGVTETIRRAEDAPIPELQKISDLPLVPERQIFKANLSPLFDKHVSICRGQVSVWTGYPGHGKSTLLSQVCVNLSRLHGFKIAWKAFEDDYVLDFRPRVASQLHGRATTSLTQEHWRDTDAFLDRYVRVISDPQGMQPITHAWLMERMEAAVRRHGVQMCVLDPWTNIETGSGKHSEVDQHRSELARWIEFARRMDVHLAIVAHPRKQESDDHIPVGRDISGSANWVNMIDLGVSCWRDEEPNYTDSDCKIKVWKVKRQQTMGPLGTFGMDFHSASHTFGQPHKTREAA